MSCEVWIPVQRLRNQTISINLTDLATGNASQRIDVATKIGNSSKI